MRPTTRASNTTPAIAGQPRAATSTASSAPSGLRLRARRERWDSLDMPRLSDAAPRGLFAARRSGGSYDPACDPALARPSRAQARRRTLSEGLGRARTRAPRRQRSIQCAGGAARSGHARGGVGAVRSRASSARGGVGAGVVRTRNLARGGAPARIMRHNYPK